MDLNSAGDSWISIGPWHAAELPQIKRPLWKMLAGVSHYCIHCDMNWDSSTIEIFPK